MDGQGGSVEIIHFYHDAFTGISVDAGKVDVEPFGCRIIEIEE